VVPAASRQASGERQAGGDRGTGAGRRAVGPARGRTVGGALDRFRELVADGARLVPGSAQRGAGSPDWVSGLLAGLQGALLSLLLAVVPTVAAYVATSADPTNTGISWPRAAAVGAGLWLLALGGPLHSATGPVTMVPLGLTALALFAAYASARRTARPVRSAWLAGVGGYLAMTVVAALAVADAGPLGTGAGGVIRLVLGAAAVAAVGLGLGCLPSGAFARASRLRVPRWPLWARGGLRAGLIALAAHVAVAAAVVATWALAGRAATGDVLAALGVDAFGGVLLGIGQLALVPNLVLWAAGWLSGPGFAVGAGTSFTPADVQGGPLPALPLLGALPNEGGGVLAWAPVVVVLLGLLVGLGLRREVEDAAAWHVPAAVGVAGLVAGVGAALGAALAGGAAGPGRLAVVGGEPWLVGVATGGLVLVGAALVIPGSATVRAATARAWARAWGRVRPTSAP
jgi:hypothetical protein